MPYIIDRQPFAWAAVLAVQVIPSGEVITLLAPSSDTAAKRPPPYVIDCQLFAWAAVLAVQVIPSGEVITLLAPSTDTATKRPLPYAIELRAVVSGVVLETQSTAFPLPLKYSAPIFLKA